VERATATRATPLTVLESKELIRRMRECFEKLPAPWSTVIALRDAEEMAYEEISRALRIELGTVRSRLARARIALRDCVEGRAS
jgi:RNA polymerase sigma-70 factor (ECF subfamily)